MTNYYLWVERIIVFSVIKHDFWDYLENIKNVNNNSRCKRAAHVSECICRLFPFSFSRYIYVNTYAELHDFLGNSISDMTMAGGPTTVNGSKVCIWDANKANVIVSECTNLTSTKSRYERLLKMEVHKQEVLVVMWEC